MKKLLTLVGVLALILCFSSCGSSGYDGKKVEKVLNQLKEGEIDDDVKTSEFLGQQYLIFEKQFTKECLEIAKSANSLDEYWAEIEKMREEKYPRIWEVQTYVHNHTRDIPELWQQVQDLDFDTEHRSQKRELMSIIDEWKRNR